MSQSQNVTNKRNRQGLSLLQLTTLFPDERAAQWVYSRVCGGTQLRDLATRTVSGLSPRVRGNRGAGARERHLYSAHVV